MKLVKIKDNNNEALRYGAQNGLFFRPTLCKKSEVFQVDAYCYECRESFASYWNSSEEYIGFHLKRALLAPDLVGEFFKNIEGTLQIPVSQMSEVMATEDGHGVIIKLSPFWVGDKQRHSFFTLMLRCACLYYKGDMDAAMKEYYLINTYCRKAVDHFLSGNTTSKVSFHYGFVGDHGGLTQTDLNRLLVKPDPKPETKPAPTKEEVAK